MSQKKIISGVAFSWLRFVLGFFITVIQIPLYFKYLPKEVVGVWFLFFSAAAFMQMTDLGLPSAVNRAVAYIKNKEIKSKQPEVEFYLQYTVRDIYRSAFTSFFVLALVVVFVGTLIIVLVKPGFGITQTSTNDITFAFVIFLFGVFFNMTANVPNAALNGLGDVGYDNLFRVIVQIAGLFLIWIFLPIYSSLTTLTLIYLAQGVTSTFLVHLFLRCRHRKLFRETGHFKVALVKQLYRESIPLFINQIGSWLTNQSGIWIATILLGVSQIADYSILVQLIFYGLSISLSIPAAINPYATSAFSAGGVRNTHKYFFLTLKLSTFIVGLWITILSVWGNSLLDIWIGTGHFLGYGVLIPLLINLFFEMQHSINGGFVWNTGRWPFVPATILAGLLNVSFGIIGCHLWGFAGLAIGTMLAKLLTLNWYTVYYALKRLQLSFKNYFEEYLSRGLLILFLAIPLAFLISLLLNKYQASFTFRNLPGNVLVSCLFGGVTTFLFWIVLCYNILFQKKDREIFKNIIIAIVNGRRH